MQKEAQNIKALDSVATKLRHCIAAQPKPFRTQSHTTGGLLTSSNALSNAMFVKQHYQMPFIQLIKYTYVKVNSPVGAKQSITTVDAKPFLSNIKSQKS